MYTSKPVRILLCYWSSQNLTIDDEIRSELANLRQSFSPFHPCIGKELMIPLLCSSCLDGYLCPVYTGVCSSRLLGQSSDPENHDHWGYRRWQNLALEEEATWVRVQSSYTCKIWKVQLHPGHLDTWSLSGLLIWVEPWSGSEGATRTVKMWFITVDLCGPLQL